MRNPEKRPALELGQKKENLPINILQLDVTNEKSVENAIAHIVSQENKIDVLVNNAGYVLMGAFEELHLEEIRQQFETNFFGLIRVTQAVLPFMRKRQSGIIVNISSGAGRFGYPGGSAYVGTKFAIEGLSESLAYEVYPFGIRVVVVDPGFVRTNFSKAVMVAKRTQSPSSQYSTIMKKMSSSFEQMLQNSSPPQLVAEVVLKAVTTKDPDLRYLAGKDVEQWVDQKQKMSYTAIF
jgi:NAD(P)-dependent dehydrogenase (short-subunit alcohol dehydrogenase family)